MSYTTITMNTRDLAFQDRVIAGAMKEAIAGGPEFSESQFAETLKLMPGAAVSQFIWPLAIANEADYAYAVDNGNENPGGDPGVIGDDEIQAGIQANWPPDTL